MAMLYKASVVTLILLQVSASKTKATSSIAFLQQSSNVSRRACRRSCAADARGGVLWEQLCQQRKCRDCSECIPSTTATTSSLDSTTSWQSPFIAFTCEGAVLTTTDMIAADYDAVVAAIRSLYDNLPSSCDAASCPQADWAGCVLRMAGHDFMDYSDGIGGSDGCIDLHDVDNMGLDKCLYLGEHGHSLAEAYQDFCTRISLADFLVIAGEAVMTLSREHVLAENSSRASIDFRSQFKYGRTTATSCEFAKGRLPNPEDSCSAVSETFVGRMNLSWDDTAALMGVHSLGRAHVANSGYDGFWSDPENSRRFNNDFYVSMLLKGWAPDVAVAGNPSKNQWRRVDQGVDATTREMMLNTDLCLFFTTVDDGSLELDAATALENECNCTWVAPRSVEDAAALYNGGKFCGSTDMPGNVNFPLQRAICCGAEFDTPASAPIDCGLVVSPMGPAASAVRRYANNEDAWVRNFLRAWTKATENGFGSLRRL